MVQLTNPAELARQTSMAKVKVGGKRVVEFNGDAYMAIKYESFGPLCWLPVIALTAKLSSPDRETWCIVKFAWASRMCNSCHIFFSLKQANWESAIIRDTHQLAFFLCWLISVVSVQLLALGTHFVSVWHWVTLSLWQWQCHLEGRAPRRGGGLIPDLLHALLSWTEPIFMDSAKIWFCWIQFRPKGQ